MGVSWDLLIRRGLIIDGNGRPGFVGDVAVAGGRIAALGIAGPSDAKKIIDADGLAVTPGFIDIKTHSDFVLPINPKAESKVSGKASLPKSLDIVVSRSRRYCPERRNFSPTI
jgi:N-acyl-D-amino-acid deacylase